MYNDLFQFVPAAIAVITCIVLFKRGHMIWILPIIAATFEALLTVAFGLTGETSLMTTKLLPLLTSWCMLCSLVTFFLQLSLRLIRKTQDNLRIHIVKMAATAVFAVAFGVFVALLNPYLHITGPSPTAGASPTATPIATPRPQTVARFSFGNTAGNVMNGGLIDGAGGNLYYSNFNDNGYLYKISSLGLGKTQLNSEPSREINFFQDWIYYVTGEGNNLYKVSMDGAVEIKLTDDSCASVNIENDMIYYINNSDNGRIYRMRPDGTLRKMMSESSCARMAVFHGWIYYTDTGEGSTLWRMMADGTGKMRLNSDKTGVFEPVYEGVYYINEADGDSLYGIAPDGSGRKRICRDKTGTFFADMGKLFYVNRSDGDRIYVIGTDGKGRNRLGTARIGSDDAMRLTYAGSYVYFGKSRIITNGTGLEAVSW